jgi:RNA recognition motif-containing protein
MTSVKISNLPQGISQNDVYNIFSSAGHVKSVFVSPDASHGFVTFQDVAAAKVAIDSKFFSRNCVICVKGTGQESHIKCPESKVFGLIPKKIEGQQVKEVSNFKIEHMPVKIKDTKDSNFRSKNQKKGKGKGKGKSFDCKSLHATECKMEFMQPSVLDKKRRISPTRCVMQSKE